MTEILFGQWLIKKCLLFILDEKYLKWYTKYLICPFISHIIVRSNCYPLRIYGRYRAIEISHNLSHFINSKNIHLFNNLVNIGAWVIWLWHDFLIIVNCFQGVTIEKWLEVYTFTSVSTSIISVTNVTIRTLFMDTITLPKFRNAIVYFCKVPKIFIEQN